MSRKARSMRGEVVDFDLFAIKEQISGGPVTETIQNRERYIELRRKRGTKRKLDDMLAQQEASKALQQSAPDVSTEIEEAEVAQETPRRKIVKKDA